MNEKTILEAFGAAVAGDTARLKDSVTVRWRMRPLAVVGQPYRAEAFLTVGYPASHTLVIQGALDVGEAKSALRELQQQPGTGPGRADEKRILVRDLPVFIGDLLWDVPIAPEEKATKGEGTRVVARLRLRFELAGEAPSKMVELEFENSISVQSVTAWPDDYPESVKPSWSDVPLRIAARRDSGGALWIDVDLERSVDIGLAWDLRIESLDGAVLKHVDWAVARGMVQGISTPIPASADAQALRLVFEPSRRVARSESDIQRFADVRVTREVSIPR